ncbi:MAG: bifunctional diaminohydroxyphosphoribosylaminopyrimidine deaminase/5-amino-6-(5-phosphoribosylamino)uracil reductase RibD [Candidatus Celaenobacter polaris]|nr:bifunctional diaminohydroxyphosphoribosylaminopyrimidine deaminase/5-amino-6-(5-phosphoribosylamino)uracil reductase RibD [Candidatus Celaenobacter polaris]
MNIQSEKYMQLALQLAALGNPSPNPYVGCVIVKNDEIIGKGYHRQAGAPHAEVEAIKDAENNGYTTKESNLYINLEPCVHQGKTPPCVDLIISKGIQKVYMSMEDPNPLVSGLGIKKLEDAGIKIDVGLLHEQAYRLNERFIFFMRNNRPFVLLKSALSLDGKITYGDGMGKQITGMESQKYMHQLRNSYDSILVGINTVLKDDPQLNCRFPKGRDPIKIILDSKLRIPLSARVIKQNPHKLIICTNINHNHKKDQLIKKGVEIIEFSHTPINVDLLLYELANRQISSILIEGGHSVNYSFLSSGNVNKIMFFYAPSIIGEDKSIVSGNYLGIKLKNLHIQKLGADLLITGYIN